MSVAIEALQRLVDERGRLTNEMRAYLDKNEPAKFDEIDARVVAIDQQIEREQKLAKLEKAQAAFGESHQPPMLDIAPSLDNPEAKAAMQRYDDAFEAYIRVGMDGMDADDRAILQGRYHAGDSKAKIVTLASGRRIRAAQTETTTGGGYIIPQGFMGFLEEALKYYAGIMGNVSEFSTETGNPLPWPTVNDTSNMGRILTINTQVTETDEVFGQVMFGAFTGTSDIVLVPIQLLQDSYFDLNKELAKLLGIRLGRLFNNKLTVGVGTTEPSGIVTEVVNSGLTYTTAAGQTSAIVGDDLINLEHTVDVAYRAGAKYMFADSTLKAIKKLKDSYGRYLWLPGLAASDPNTINGYPYAINNDVPALGRNGSPLVGNNFMLFGDLSKYKVRRVAGEVTLLRLVERYADYLQVGFVAFMRFDGKLLDAGTHPIAVAVQAAS